MHTLLCLVLAASASFPLPAIDGKPLAVTEKQHTFRLPMRFEKVRRFYEAQLMGSPAVTLRVSGAPGERVLRLTNKSRSDAWTAATVTEKEMETVVDVTAVLQMGVTEVQGHAKPLVEFIIGRSQDVDTAVHEVIDADHLEKVRQ